LPWEEPQHGALLQEAFHVQVSSIKRELQAALDTQVADLRGQMQDLVVSSLEEMRGELFRIHEEVSEQRQRNLCTEDFDFPSIRREAMHAATTSVSDLRAMLQEQQADIDDLRKGTSDLREALHEVRREESVCHKTAGSTSGNVLAVPPFSAGMNDAETCKLQTDVENMARNLADQARLIIAVNETTTQLGTEIHDVMGHVKASREEMSRRLGEAAVHAAEQAHRITTMDETTRQLGSEVRGVKSRVKALREEMSIQFQACQTNADQQPFFVQTVHSQATADAVKQSTWKVCSGGGVNVRGTADTESEIIGYKTKGADVTGHQEGDWLRLVGEAGYMLIRDHNGTLIIPEGDASKYVTIRR
jgi:chromosome segregation ATPase